MKEEIKEEIKELKEKVKGIFFDLIEVSVYSILIQLVWNNECRTLFNLGEITLLQSASLLLIVSIVKRIGSGSEQR